MQTQLLMLDLTAGSGRKGARANYPRGVLPVRHKLASEHVSKSETAESLVILSEKSWSEGEDPEQVG